MKRYLCVAVAAMATLAVSFWASAQTTAPSGGKAHHPEMRKAYHHIREATRELEAAKHDYNGHRTAALEKAQAAMKEIIAGLESEGWKGPHALAPTSGPTSAPAEGKHGEMRRALHHLNEAKCELEHSAHDYQGHRAEALKLVEHAIRQIHEGIKSVENGAENNK